MNRQANQLRRAVEERRQFLIHRLWKMGYEKTGDGIETEDLTLSELEQIYINVECRLAKGGSL